MKVNLGYYSEAFNNPYSTQLKIAADENFFNFLILSFEENKSWFFM